VTTAADTTGDPVFDETLGFLRPHFHPECGDRNVLDVFNRLLAKNIKPAGWTKYTHMNITPEQIRSRREQWPMSELSRLPRGHAGVAGPWTRLDGPIVVVEYLGSKRLLDGSHRINTWVAAGDADLHPVHIHTIEGAGQDLELPPLVG
jgi:hypothetical protein